MDVGLTEGGEKPKDAKNTILEEAKARLRQCIEADQEERDKALDDLQFIDGEQWPTEIKNLRGNRPCLVNNRLPVFVKTVVNEQRQNRPSVKVSGVDDASDPKVAEIFEGLIRHIQRNSRAYLAYDNAFYYAVASGQGHFRITTDYVDSDGFNQDIYIKPIDNPFSVYTDPDAILPDRSDAKFRFVTQWVKNDAFKDKYGVDPVSVDGLSQEDRECWAKDDETLIAEYWKVEETEVWKTQMPDGTILDGKPTKDEMAQLAALNVMPKSRKVKQCKVCQYLITGDDVIEESQWAGKFIPIVTVSGQEQNIAGKRKRYSLIRWAKDPVRMDNYWASAEAERLALSTKAPWIGPKGFAKGMEGQWDRANTDNMAYLEYAGNTPPMRQPFDGVPVGIREARMAALEDQKATMGLYDASLGAAATRPPVSRSKPASSRGLCPPTTSWTTWRPPSSTPAGS
jgi:hypothetical protein